MTLEQGLILALSTVVSALAYLYNQLRLKSDKCEQWRDRNELVIQQLLQKVGELSALSILVNGCRVEGCAFAGRKTETFSLLPPPHAPQ